MYFLIGFKRGMFIYGNWWCNFWVKFKMSKVCWVFFLCNVYIFVYLELIVCWVEKFYDWYYFEVEMYSWKSLVLRGIKIIRFLLSFNYYIYLICIVLNYFRIFYFNIFIVLVVIIKYYWVCMCNFFYYEVCYI